MPGSFRTRLRNRERLLGNVARLVEQREQFYTVLDSIEWLEPYPSQTNFILCRVKGRDASDLKKQLAEHGILVRYYNSSGLTDHIRISMGTAAQMARLAKVLHDL